MQCPGRTSAGSLLRNPLWQVLLGWSTDLHTHTHRIFSLVHLLIDYAFGAAVRIAYGNRDGGNKDGRDGARSAVKSGGCCAAKTTPPNITFALRVLQHPPRPANQIPINRIDHRSPFAQRKQRPWSIDADWRGQRPSRDRVSWDIVQNWTILTNRSCEISNLG